MNQVFQQGLQSINKIAQQTSFNGTPLLDGTQTQVAISFGDFSNSLNLANQTTTALGLDNIDILNPANASSSLQSLSDALDLIGLQRADFGAQQETLTSTVSSLQEQNLNAQASRSQILDTDFAKGVAEQVRNNILQDSAILMQAQTNQSRASVLQLLNS